MWKLKLDANGNVVLQDGKPVYVKPDGAEVAFDAEGTTATITRLNGEAKTHREAKEAAEATLAKFAGIADPAAAVAALDTVSKIDQKKLIDAGEVDRVRSEISKGFETKLTEAEKRAQGLESELYQERVGGAFGRSKFVADKLAIPADMVQAAFGKHFTMDGGKIVALDAGGQKIYSQSNPGELAGFDEALGILVDRYPNKDHILKGTGAKGSGASTSIANTGGKKTITRAQFATLSPKDQAAEVGAGTVVTDN
jgi:hypothetical protein